MIIHIFNERAAIDGIRTGRENRSVGENLPQCLFVYYKARITWD
jgi:hypothetical protein